MKHAHVAGFFSAGDDYEDLTRGQRAVAIYDYEGGVTVFYFLTFNCLLMFATANPFIFGVPHRG